MIPSLRQIAFGALRWRLPPSISLAYVVTQLGYALEGYEPTLAWDPPQIVGQIIAMQVGHYICCAGCTILLLVVFSDWNALQRDGGAMCVCMLLDWHEWKTASDRRRGWVLAASWIITSFAE